MAVLYPTIVNSVSVNDALVAAAFRNDACIEIQGLLRYEFERITLDHWPKAEQHFGNFDSSIWLETEGVFAFNDAVMRKWNGKRVVVLGVFEIVQISRIDGSFGFGHMDLWPARLKVRRIDLWKERLKQQGDSTLLS